MDHALSQASRRPSGTLAGVPLLVKDMFATAGIRTTYGSAIFRDHVPPSTAPVVRALEAAGALMLGKANQHEFAWGVTSQNPHWGDVENPSFPGCVAGGSSGGNAAALASGMCAIGLGTDTGGSVRIPAACCGVVGFKPPYGVVSTAGVFPLAKSFDTVGPMARSVADCALVYSTLSGRPVPTPRLAGLRVGVLEPTGLEGAFEELGALLEEVRLPKPQADLTTVFLAECAVSHMSIFPRYRDQYGPDTQEKWDAAFRVPAVEYIRSMRALRAFRRQTLTEPDVDIFISPTLPIIPPQLTCWEPDVREAMTKFTRRFNHLGWPAIAIGNLQIAGRVDLVVLGAALAWENSHPGPVGFKGVTPRESRLLQRAKVPEGPGPS